ncbi:MAG: DUF342 domain-containing protein [Clostridia bacterium]|nr:DUF342 domain-containing protein [Clostridia bacterium]
MNYYEWTTDEENFIVRKNPEITDIDQLISYFTREIKIRNIKLDSMAIAKWAESGISEITVGSKEKTDTSAKVEISYNGKMTKAFLTMYPDLITGALPSADMVTQEISKQGITNGIIEVAVIKIKNSKERFVDELFAETRDAVNGKDAEIIYHFANVGPAKPKLLEDGRADFYNTNVIENVKKGQVIIEKKPPTTGVPGLTVKGKAIHAMDGKNKKLPIGKNIEHSSDGFKAIATIDGMLSTARNRVSILPIFEVNGDVDFSTGNIEFVGNVIVKGSVKNGFMIKSGGDVHVYGIVEGGSIEAEGNIFIMTGIRGLKKSHISAKGTISTKFIENASIRANLDVIAEEAIMHCEVVAGNSVVLSKNKGLIVGGIVRAAQFIKCKNIGNNLATRTEFEIGVDPSLKDEFMEVSKEYNEIKENIKKSRQGVRILEEMKERLGELPPPKEKMLMDLAQSLKSSMVKEEELRHEVVDFSEKLNQLKEAFIEVEETINPGTEVRIGEYSKRFTNQNYKVKIYLSHGDIVVTPLI